MVAHGATFRLAGPKGERLVPAANYFTLPRQNVRVENALAPDELLTHVILPSPGNVKSGHYEVRYKASHDWPNRLRYRADFIQWRHRTVGQSRDGCRCANPVAVA